MLSTRRVTVAAGDPVILETGGGAGHGEPRLRDPEAVHRDVREGYVSAKAAQELYGLNGL